MNVFSGEVKAEGVAVSESVKACDADRESVSRLRNSMQVGDVSQAFNHFDLQGSLALITLSYLKVLGPDSKGERSRRAD